MSFFVGGVGFTGIVYSRGSLNEFTEDRKISSVVIILLWFSSFQLLYLYIVLGAILYLSSRGDYDDSKL